MASSCLVVANRCIFGEDLTRGVVDTFEVKVQNHNKLCAFCARWPELLHNIRCNISRIRVASLLEENQSVTEDNEIK
jgi:hypothetical protein